MSNQLEQRPEAFAASRLLARRPWSTLTWTNSRKNTWWGKTLRRCVWRLLVLIKHPAAWRSWSIGP